jgi:hypothetical protein
MTVFCYIRRKILVVLGVFTTLGLVTGTVTPWWVVLITRDTRLVHGLWYSLSCDVSSGLSLCKSLLGASDSIIGSKCLSIPLNILKLSLLLFPYFFFPFFLQVTHFSTFNLIKSEQFLISYWRFD